jgi:hypothetical protein
MQEEDTFIRLVEAVEAQGGELLPETHHPTPFVYKIEGPNGRSKSVEVEGTGCGEDTLLRIPYEDHKPDKQGVESPDGAVHDIKVCAIDDLVHLWPRFAEGATA